MKKLACFAVVLLGTLGVANAHPYRCDLPTCPPPYPMPCPPIPPVDLNKVDAKCLVKTVKGLGKRRAKAIVAYRTVNGPFTNVKELLKVKGISQQFYHLHAVQFERTLKIAA